MLPKDKADLAAVEELASASPAEVVALLPALLTWLRDANWPVARPIAEVLRGHPLELIDPVNAILRGDDEVWKYWVIVELLLSGPASLRDGVADEVMRIVNRPTLAEQAEEVHLVARDVVFVQSYVDP